MTSSDLDTTATAGAGHAKDFGWTVDSHQFSLLPSDSNRNGDAQNSFTIGQSTGQIAVKLNAPLDHETMSRITLYVKVSDQNINGGWSQPIGVEGSLFIDVNNINERPVMDPAGPFYFKKFSPSGTEIGTLTATDPDQNVLGVSSPCCYTYRFNKGAVQLSGSWGGKTANDLAVDATTGIITVNQNNIDTSALQPTTYIMSMTVDDLPTATSGSYSRLTSEPVDVKVEVINENNRPDITGGEDIPGKILNINENSVAGAKVDGGFVTCTDAEVNSYCTTDKNNQCNGFTDQPTCDGRNECEWITLPRAANSEAVEVPANRCACRRQRLEFFAEIDNPRQQTPSPDLDDLPIIFTFKSGADSSTKIYYDNGLPQNVGGSLTGVKVKAEIFVLGTSMGNLDYESYKSLDVTYGCRDTGFRAGENANDPPVGWMQSNPSPACSSPPCTFRVKVNINDVNEPPFFSVVVGSNGKYEMEVDENKDYLALTENYDPFIVCRDLDKIGNDPKDTTEAVTLVLQNVDGTTSTEFELDKGPCSAGENLLDGAIVCPASRKRPFCAGSIIKPTGTSSGGWLPNFETQQYYELKIVATDQANTQLPGNTGDAKSSTLLVRIRVRDKNDQPEIERHSSFSNSVWSVQEDAPAAFVVGKFKLVDADIDTIKVTWREPNSAVDVLDVTIQSGNDGTAFELAVVGGTGTAEDPKIVDLRYRGEMATFPGATAFGLDYERQKQYTLVVRVTDAGGPNKLPSLGDKPDSSNPLRPQWTKTALFSEITQTINVIDVNDVTIDKIVVQTSSSTLSTGGGEKVKITGTNFGAVWSGSLEPILEVTYTNPLAPVDASSNDPTSPTGTGSAGINTIFTAQNCVRNNTVTTFVANTEIICDAAPGFGNNQIWTVKITGSSEGQKTSISQTSYSYPVITSVAISGGANTMNTLGGESVLLTGTNMGPVGTQYWGDYGPTRLGGYGYCAGRTAGTGTWCTTTVANTQVTCTTSAGVGTSNSWRLQERKHSTWKTIEQSSVSKTSGTGTLHYTKPIVTNVQLPPQAVNGGGLRTQGGEDVVLSGTGFGSPNTNLYPCRAESSPPNGNVYPPAGPSAPVARYGHTGFEYPRRPGGNTECTDSTKSGCGAVCVVQSDTNMTCTTEPAVGANHAWTVIVAGQVSDPSSVLTSHRIPVLSVITGTGLKGGDTQGGTTVNIVGDQFGPIPPRNENGDYSYLIEAIYGRWDFTTNSWNTEVVPVFSSNCIMVSAHTSLQCTTSPGIGKNLSWAITVHAKTAQTSLPNHAEGSYAPPSLYTIKGKGGTEVQAVTTMGRDHIIIEGTNFGPKGKIWNVPTLTYG